MVKGRVLVTVAETSKSGSNSQRDPVEVLGSGTGRNALGNTNELMAALTGD